MVKSAKTTKFTRKCLKGDFYYSGPGPRENLFCGSIVFAVFLILGYEIGIECLTTEFYQKLKAPEFPFLYSVNCLGA